MKDVRSIFTENIDDIQKNLKDANYSTCGRIAHDLTRFACNLELEDEVFTSEVLESIFDSLISIADHAVPDNIKDEINSKISKKIRDMAEAYDANDQSKLWENLKQLRYMATRHQLNVWQRYDEMRPRRISRY